MERILVTGASGFVGGALGRVLRASGRYHVTGLSRTPPRESACDDFIPHDLAAPLPAGEQPFDVIVHAAALAAPWGTPAAYERANIAATANMIAFAQRTKPRRFVFVSSSAVHYAYADQTGLTEESPWPARPVNLYAATKRRGEAMVRESGLNWTIARPRAVFGPGDTVVFPHILKAARAGALPRLVRPDGEAPRADLLYIDNLVWYLARIVERDAGGVFCLTNGEPIEIPAMLDHVLAALALTPKRPRIPVSVAMNAAGAMEFAARTFQNWREPRVTRFGVASLAFSKTFDVARARRELGDPPVPLADGMAAFLAWQKPLLVP